MSIKDAPSREVHFVFSPHRETILAIGSRLRVLACGPSRQNGRCSRAVLFCVVVVLLGLCGCLLVPLDDPALVKSSAQAGGNINDPWPGRIAALSSGPISVLLYMVVVRPMRRWMANP